MFSECVAGEPPRWPPMSSCSFAWPPQTLSSPIRSGLAPKKLDVNCLSWRCLDVNFGAGQEEEVKQEERKSVVVLVVVVFSKVVKNLNVTRTVRQQTTTTTTVATYKPPAICKQTELSLLLASTRQAQIVDLEGTRLDSSGDLPLVQRAPSGEPREEENMNIAAREADEGQQTLKSISLRVNKRAAFVVGRTNKPTITFWMLMMMMMMILN